MIARIITIDQLTSVLKVIIEDDDDLQDIWVDGEISNLTIARSGHAYFTLKDATSQLSAVMWRTALARQQTLPREGDRVIAHGSVTFYQPRGNLQLQLDVLQPQGTGILQLQLEELRQRLEAEGLFDPGRKRALPEFPKRIGVVTSASGAVWHDIQQVISRRFPLAELILSPSLVQGDGAPESIVQALACLQETAAPDVIIIGRGGGSLEDLWAFNDERVVRAVFAARVPVISAVGHETDTTLVDFVADMRAPTPSAAAELAVPDLSMIAEGLEDVRFRLDTLIERQLAEAMQLLDDMQDRLVRVSPLTRLETLLHDLEPLEIRLQNGIRHRLQMASQTVRAFTDVLEALNPQSLMGRGYSFICDDTTGMAIRSIDQVSTGTSIRAILGDGEIGAKVSHVRHRNTLETIHD